MQTKRVSVIFIVFLLMVTIIPSINFFPTVQANPDAPYIYTEAPSNGTTQNYNRITTGWGIEFECYVSDPGPPDTDNISWTIEASNGASNSGTVLSGGPGLITLNTGSTLFAYDSTIYIWVNVSDDESPPNQRTARYDYPVRSAHPPTYGTPNPANGTSDKDTSFTWSIPIADDMTWIDWSIVCSNGQHNENTWDSAGTKSLSLSGLSYSTTYKVWVNSSCNDEGSFVIPSYTKKWYTFETKSSPAWHPPVFGIPAPTNNSVGQSLSFSWGIPITDTNGTFNWTIQCSNGQHNQANGASNGTKTVSLSGLTYSHLYKVWVNATDGTNTTRRWYQFTTRANRPPGVSSENPINHTAHVSRWLSQVSAEIQSPEGAVMDWSIEVSNGDANYGYGDSNGTINCPLTAPLPIGVITWYVNVTDKNATIHTWYEFTTSAPHPPFFNYVIPTNGSILFGTNWLVYISDPAGDTYDWTIECSNGEQTAGFNSANMSHTLTLLSLEEFTIYKIWVNATDGVNWTRRWYTFDSGEFYGPGGPGHNNTQIFLFGQNTQTRAGGCSFLSDPYFDGETYFVVAYEPGVQFGTGGGLYAYSYNGTNFTLLSHVADIPVQWISGNSFSAFDWQGEGITGDPTKGDDGYVYVMVHTNITHQQLRCYEWNKNLATLTYRCNITEKDAYLAGGGGHVATGNYIDRCRIGSDGVLHVVRGQNWFLYLKAYECDGNSFTLLNSINISNNMGWGSKIRVDASDIQIYDDALPYNIYISSIWGFDVFDSGNITTYSWNGINYVYKANLNLDAITSMPPNQLYGTEYESKRYLFFTTIWGLYALRVNSTGHLTLYDSIVEGDFSSLYGISSDGYSHIFATGSGGIRMYEFSAARYHGFFGSISTKNDGGTYYGLLFAQNRLFSTARGSGIIRAYSQYNTPPTQRPVLGTPTPPDMSDGNPLSFTWSIPITDADSTFDWTIQCENGQQSSGTDDSSGTKLLSLSGLDYSTIYIVYVNATDGEFNPVRGAYWFSTMSGGAYHPPIFGTPSPTNQSIALPISFTWSIPISDSGGTFDWTIQCSNGQHNQVNGATTGIKSLSISGLLHDTTYRVYVNATDGTNTTKAWFTFKTVRQGEQPVVPINPVANETRYTIPVPELPKYSPPAFTVPEMYQLLHATNLSNSDAEITVMVIDSGVIPITYNNIQLNKISTIKGMSVNNQFDENGHGTWVNYAVAYMLQTKIPHARQISYRVFGADGSCTTSEFIAALETAKQMHVDIVSISAGVLGTKDDAFVKAVEDLRNSGIIIIVAAGNFGPSPSSIASPGISDSVIAVAASDPILIRDETLRLKGILNLKDDLICPWSSRGPVVGTMKPDVTAPGESIMGPWLYDERTLSGTSMATPLISGGIALVYANNKLEIDIVRTLYFWDKSIIPQTFEDSIEASCLAKGDMNSWGAGIVQFDTANSNLHSSLIMKIIIWFAFFFSIVLIVFYAFYRSRNSTKKSYGYKVPKWVKKL